MTHSPADDLPDAFVRDLADLFSAGGLSVLDCLAHEQPGAFLDAVATVLGKTMDLSVWSAMTSQLQQALKRELYAAILQGIETRYVNRLPQNRRH